MGAQTHSSLGCSCAGVWRLQDALTFLGSSNQACQGSRRRRCCRTGRQLLWGCCFSSQPMPLCLHQGYHKFLKYCWVPEHIIWLWSCYQTQNHNSFLPIGNGQSSCQLPSHAQKCSGCQAAWIKSEPRTSPKCEWQCLFRPLCGSAYLVQRWIL